jgi:hypothetical protein
MPYAVMANKAKSKGIKTDLEYQPLLPRELPTSNTKIKVTKYSTNGTIHKKGTEAIFCVM